MPPLSQFRPVSAPLEVGASVVTAPVPAGPGPGTHTAHLAASAAAAGIPVRRRTSNRSTWLQIALFVNPPRNGRSA